MKKHHLDRRDFPFLTVPPVPHFFPSVLTKMTDFPKSLCVGYAIFTHLLEKTVQMRVAVREQIRGATEGDSERKTKNRSRAQEKCHVNDHVVSIF